MQYIRRASASEADATQLMEWARRTGPYECLLLEEYLVKSCGIIALGILAHTYTYTHTHTHTHTQHRWDALSCRIGLS